MASTVNQNSSNSIISIARSLQVASGNIINQGTLVCKDSNGRAIIADTTHPVVGIATNKKGGGYIVTVDYNHVVELSLPGVSESNIGDLAYIATNITLTLTPNTAVVGQIVGVDTASEKVFVHMTLLNAQTNGGGVDSVFGRIGDVVAAASDYKGSQIDNDSGVAGLFVSDALDNLAAAIPVVPVLSVFTRTGDVVGVASDYDASQVDNDSIVTGDFVDDALDRLHNYETKITKTENYTVQIGDNLIGVDTTSGDVTITLPSASGIAGLRVRVCKESVDDNKVTILPAGGETIADQASWELNDPGNSITLFAGGSTYWCIYADRQSTNMVFFPVEPDANLGNHRVQNIAATGNHRFEFHIPHDFLSLVSACMIASPASGAAGAGKDIDLSTDYAAPGELYNAHSESDTTTTYNTGVTNTLFDLNISAVLTSVSGGDTCGLLIEHNSIGGTISYYGIEIKYVRKN